MFSVRLACVKRAASVRPEPGSNSLFKLYIQTLRVFISILAITISLAITFFDFFVFSDFLKFQSLGISRAFFACSALFNFQDTFEAVFCAATFTLYHIQKFLSSKHFVNCCSFLFSRTFPSRRDQLFYFITSCPVCQVNNLWTKVQAAHFSFSPNKLPKTVSLSILSHFRFPVKWTFLEQPSPATVNLPIRALASFALSFS